MLVDKRLARHYFPLRPQRIDLNQRHPVAGHLVITAKTITRSTGEADAGRSREWIKPLHRSDYFFDYVGSRPRTPAVAEKSAPAGRNGSIRLYLAGGRDCTDKPPRLVA